jgi:serine/threonine-protein kinase
MDREREPESDPDAPEPDTSLPTGTAPRLATPRARRSSSASRTSSGRSAIRESRFVPGTLLNERYRIAGLLGRGGMGEVYRADDLLLGQAVALKFLPESLKDDPDRLERFYDEVRIALRITHPVVCRTYDVQHHEGQPFLSMELVDGEDLKTLLRRIGRLPTDKALEIARQLCAGLAAAHSQGVLHRDLKPENVMIDGEGRVRITDFGLAAAAESIHDDDVRSGTPAYMAPEQLAGRDVTQASDVYALGLVLYELFTGKRAFSGRTHQELMRQHAETDVARPSSVIADLDPAVEQVVLRCLEKDPTRRPASPLAVAASLPGADPLAAALAAGETPSPELVAAAGRSEGLPPLLAWAGLAFAALGLLAVPLLSTGEQFIEQVPLEAEPAVLESRAREILARAGHAAPVADRKSGIRVDDDYLSHVRATDDSPDRWSVLASGRPPVFYFWYRESPHPLVPTSPWGEVSIDQPPRSMTGMAMTIVDGEGRLVELSTVPPQVEDPDEAGPPPEADWAALFEEAGLDIAAFTPVESRWTPPTYADGRAAWTGAYPERPELEVRVEAASYLGRPVYFRLFGEWSRAWRMAPFRGTRGQQSANAIGVALICLTLGLAGLLARRNARLGRGDRAGARRLSVFIFAANMLSWLLVADHTFGTSELGLALRAGGLSLLGAAFIWLLYLAVEPYVRRQWPHRLISWSRLLAGGWRDPLVGRDVLIGGCAGSLIACLIAVHEWVPERLGVAPPPPSTFLLHTLLGPHRTSSAIIDFAVEAIYLGMGFLLLLLLLRLALRREALAAAALVLLLSVQNALASELDPWIALVLSCLIWTIPTVVLLRFGLLPTIVGMFVIFLMENLPITSRLDHWTAAPTLWAMAVVAGVLVWGFRCSLGARSLLGEVLDA